jgi:hypothetical protein
MLIHLFPLAVSQIKQAFFWVLNEILALIEINEKNSLTLPIKTYRIGVVDFQIEHEIQTRSSTHLQKPSATAE